MFYLTTHSKITFNWNTGGWYTKGALPPCLKMCRDVCLTRNRKGDQKFDF